MHGAACEEDCFSASPPAGRRPAVLLMTYGSVGSLDEVAAYYTRILGGRSLAPELLAELVARYRAIGGSSPLADRTERQRAALEAELARRGLDVPVRAGMRYAVPAIADVVAALADEGIDHLVGLPLAPHFSRASTCAYGAALRGACAAVESGLSSQMVHAWHTEPQLVVTWADALVEALVAADADVANTPVLFTAHSLPQRLVDSGDPYPALVTETARLVAAAAGLPDGGWSIAFQSAGRSPEPWLGPSLRERIEALADAGARAAAVAPIGFVADHLEILYDLDIEAAGWAAARGLTLLRTRMPNDSPPFIGAMADVVVSRLAPRPA